MMGCEMALYLNGRWEVQQFSHHLQAILSKYRENFDSRPVADSLKLDRKINNCKSDDEKFASEAKKC